MTDEQRAMMIEKQRQSMMLGTITHEGDGLTPRTTQGWVGLTNVGATVRNPFGHPTQSNGGPGLYVYVVIQDVSVPLLEQKRVVIPESRVIVIDYEAQ